MREQAKIRPWMIAAFSLLILAGIAWAIKPTRSDAGLQMKNSASWQGDTAVPRVYYKTGSGLFVRNPDNSETGPISAGSASTLSSVYNVGAGASDQTITETGGHGNQPIFLVTSVANAQTAGLQLQNTTAATAGAGNQQWSPSAQFSGKGWNGAASVTTEWMIQETPITGGTDAGALSFLAQYNGAGWTNDLQIFHNAGTPQLRSGTLNGSFLELGNTVQFGANSGVIRPATDNSTSMGYPAGNHWSAVASYWFATKAGTQLTAAATITPTAAIHHVTGATTIDTIAITNVNQGVGGNTHFTMVADGGTITWSAAGNVKKAGTVAQDNMEMFVWIAADSKWFPER